MRNMVKSEGEITKFHENISHENMFCRVNVPEKRKGGSYNK